MIIACASLLLYTVFQLSRALAGYQGALRGNRAKGNTKLQYAGQWLAS